MGESESLSANPSESHLCFSPANLWPFSSSLLPNSVSVRSWGGTGEAGRGRRKRGNIFLWMFPVVPNVRKCFQAWRSRGNFFLFFFSKHWRASNFFFCCVSDWPPRARKASFNQPNRNQSLSDVRNTGVKSKNITTQEAGSLFNLSQVLVLFEITSNPRDFCMLKLVWPDETSGPKLYIYVHLTISIFLCVHKEN